MSPKTHWEKLFSGSHFEILLLEPRSDTDAVAALDALRERKVVVMQLDYLSDYQKQRVADYLAGCACAIDGKTQWVGAQTLLCAPPGVEINVGSKI